MKAAALTLHKKLKEARIAVRLITQDVAEQLGVDVETIHDFERGRAVPDKEQIRKLATILDNWELLDVFDAEVRHQQSGKAKGTSRVSRRAKA